MTGGIQFSRRESSLLIDERFFARGSLGSQDGGDLSARRRRASAVLNLADPGCIEEIFHSSKIYDWMNSYQMFHFFLFEFDGFSTW